MAARHRHQMKKGRRTIMASKKSSKIALILFTLRDFGKTTAEINKTLKRVRKIGYENIQVSGGPYTALDPAEMRQMADDNGLKIVGAHIGLSAFEESVPAVVDRIHAYGAAYVAIPSYNPGTEKAADWRKFAAKCNRIGKSLCKQGITLQYHNHAYEFQKLGIRGGKGGVTPHSVLMNGTDKNALQAELDVAWVARGGYDPAEYLKGLKGRVDQIHAKDWGVVGNEPVWRAVGEGGLNWKAINRAAKAAGVKTYIVEQDNCPITNDPFKSIAVSFENLMGMSL